MEQEKKVPVNNQIYLPSAIKQGLRQTKTKEKVEQNAVRVEKGVGLGRVVSGTPPQP